MSERVPDFNSRCHRTMRKPRDGSSAALAGLGIRVVPTWSDPGRPLAGIPSGHGLPYLGTVKRGPAAELADATLASSIG
jgi:hypothetical protein